MVVRFASLVFFALVSVAQAKPLLVDDAQLASLRANAKVVSSLLKKCDKELSAPTHAVADFAPAPRYTAQGANPDDDHAKGLTGDIRRAYRAALCFRLSGNTAYAKQAQTTTDTWANTMKSASSAQGRSDINFNIAQLIVATSWLEGVNGWSAASFKSWLESVITPLTLSAEPNNRGNWGNLQDVAIAAFTDNQPALNKAALRWQSLVASQIADDGTFPLEICRSNSSNHCDGPDKGVNGLAYTHYALLPTTIAGAILQQEGMAALPADPTSMKLAAAYRKTLGFTLHPETFPFFISNNNKLNKIDYCSYFPLLRRELASAGLTSVPTEREHVCSGDYWLLQTLFAN